MFQNFQNTLLKKMLKAKGVPEAQIDMFVKMIEKNPELFKTIAKEIEEKVKGGMSQMDAGMQVMKKHEQELKKLA
ncbi:hypothetical protein A2917_00620 [Candidatus Nomurabacteria bacterium RIFCSPLOWO2_01_FULL_42_17]|uniref:Uncharacterized protein n=1 Tax=Candidatus Nomurabacteria bacterium RIFCSPLOWO2_01_FULL_42_17 TaxID=1801780 RepID=A0A1F6XNE9_9BACT|nr:MAG: hypothetical protein A2917_00620 [Candidatus Nomurabacteria bacterium RIFCSPLOWO2_01_FULL_42_17]